MRPSFALFQFFQSSYVYYRIVRAIYIIITIFQHKDYCITEGIKNSERIALHRDRALLINLCQNFARWNSLDICEMENAYIKKKGNLST